MEDLTLYQDYVLHIYDHHIDFANLGLSLTPTTLRRAGDIGPAGHRVPYDHWACKYSGEDGLAQLLQALLPCKDRLRALAKQYLDVKISVYLRSQAGQMGLTWPAAAVQQLGELGLPVEIDILSFGMVEDSR